MAGLIVNDQPEKQLDYAATERIARLPSDQQAAAYAAANAGGTPRLFVGRRPDGSSQVALRDPAGHKRLVLTVTQAGAASIQFLDVDGKVVGILEP